MISEIKKKVFPRLKNNRGSVLLTTYLLITSLLILGAAFLVMGANENRRSAIGQKTTQAFYIAEAGLEQVLYELKQEFETGDQSWTDDVTIDGTDHMADSTNFYAVYTDKEYPDGAYTHAFSRDDDDNYYNVSLKNVSGEDDIWIRSTGTVDDITQTVQMYVRLINVSMWNNAIFAGAGSSGKMINGNVDIRGSVHVLGTGLASTDTAITIGGDAELVGNNYQGLDPVLEAKVPILPTVIIPGETNPSETLNAELRVKNGTVSVSGSASVGEKTKNPDIDDGEKENVDGTYVTNGFSGGSGASSVYSDNLASQGYDLGDAVDFPSLADISSEDAAKTRQEYFASQAITDAVKKAALVTELYDVKDDSNFEIYVDVNVSGSFDEGDNGISMDGSGNMVIWGRVYVEGPVNIGGTVNPVDGDYESGNRDPINYSGTGTILAEGDVSVSASFTTSGNNSFPTNIIGLMTPEEMVLGENAQLDIMGVFYAEKKVTTKKQTDIVGSMVTDYFDTGGQVPAIYQVPETASNLPPGMVDDGSVWYAKIVSWQKCNSQTDCS